MSTTAVTNPTELAVSSLWQSAGSLLLVLLCVFALAWFLKRFRDLRPGSQPLLQVLAALSVGSRERILIVRAGPVDLLIGVAQGRVQPLHTFNTPIDVGGGTPAPVSVSSAFADQLRKLLSPRPGPV